MKSAQSRADALAYWVVSDHFEELGRPPALLHGGFGLMTVTRVDATHSNLAARWHGDHPWPTEAELAELRSNDRLDVEDLGVIDKPPELKLPMPGIVRLQWKTT